MAATLVSCPFYACQHAARIGVNTRLLPGAWRRRMTCGAGDATFTAVPPPNLPEPAGVQRVPLLQTKHFCAFPCHHPAFCSRYTATRATTPSPPWNRSVIVVGPHLPVWLPSPTHRDASSPLVATIAVVSPFYFYRRRPPGPTPHGVPLRLALLNIPYLILPALPFIRWVPDSPTIPERTGVPYPLPIVCPHYLPGAEPYLATPPFPLPYVSQFYTVVGGCVLQVWWLHTRMDVTFYHTPTPHTFTPPVLEQTAAGDRYGVISLYCS